MKKYFKNIEEHEIFSVREMCKAIEGKSVFVVCTENKWKMLVSNGKYTYDYTFNLCRWGFARKAKNSDFLACLHKYCPNQDISSTLSRFLNTAVDEGLYERTTTEKFDGGCSFQTIWMC